MSEEYVDYAKKHRPRTWDEIVGQETVIKSLRSAVIHDKIPSAYIFSGTRGTGKTTAALILAKAINCENPPIKKGKRTGNPCNECDTCVGIDENYQSGFNYLSAANIDGVAAVRAIVEKARLAQPLKKQIWIIDEVQRHSVQAWDAYLIPLEDSTLSKNCLFIFCTTEVQKIPAPIMSRCQARTFGLLEKDSSIEYLKKIVEEEKMEVEEVLFTEAAKMGRGSMRDTISALEELMAAGPREMPESFGDRILKELAKKNVAGLLTILAEAVQQGISMRDLQEQLFEDLRDLLVALALKTYDADQKVLLKGLLGNKGLLLLLNEVGTGITELAGGMEPRIRFEITLVKCVQKLNALTAKTNA